MAGAASRLGPPGPLAAPQCAAPESGPECAAAPRSRRAPSRTDARTDAGGFAGLCAQGCAAPARPLGASSAPHEERSRGPRASLGPQLPAPAAPGSALFRTRVADVRFLGPECTAWHWGWRLCCSVSGEWPLPSRPLSCSASPGPGEKALRVLSSRSPRSLCPRERPASLPLLRHVGRSDAASAPAGSGGSSDSENELQTCLH